MSLVPTREDQAFSRGYQQASASGGAIIDLLSSQLETAKAEITKLRAERDAVREDLRSCTESWHRTKALQFKAEAAARDMRERCASEAFVVLACVVISDTGGTELADHVASAIRALPDRPAVLATDRETSNG